MIASRVIAHRGASSLAPENTLAALELAAQVGAKWLEIDAQILADDTVVVFHDDTLERCTDGSGALADARWDALALRDAGRWFSPRWAGERVPRLADFLVRCRELGLGLNLEIKIGRVERREALVQGVLGELQATAFPADSLLISSFDPQALMACRSVRPELRRGQLCEEVPLDRLQRLRAAVAPATIHPDWRRLTPESVERLTAAGLEVYAWTANEPTAFAPLWEWGVSGVITDCPQAFLEAGETPL